mmetsp:Transcript_24940/g.57992  ORF Transcript_24940/g.57992 Transcript_24940/m.57992 type:complete len:336 (+) Transcript_24940:100-1107(+)
MGNAPAVEVHANADSPSMPGKCSVLTDSLDEYCDYNSFVDELLPLLKEPLYPLESYVLKSHEIKPLDGESFTVKIIHDGVKLKTYGFGKYVKEGQDFLRLWQTVRCDRAKREIIAEEYDDQGDVQAICCTRFLDNPLRVEFWCDMPNGQRKCDEQLASIVKSFYVIPVLKSLMKRKVVVNLGVESPGGNGKSAISGPLDDYLDFDGCFDAVLEVLRESVDGKADGTVTDLSDNEFEMKVTAPSLGEGDTDQEPSGTQLTQLIRYDRTTGEIINVASMGGQLLYTSWITIHERPLRIEHWTEVDGKRICGRQEGTVLQNFVDSVVAKSDGTSGWFF